MKKKVILLCVAALLVGTSVIGGTLAGFSTEAKQSGVSEITTNNFSIEIKEVQGQPAGSEEAQLTENGAAPGGSMTFSRYIENTAEYDLYARVTIYKRWDKDGLDGNYIKLYQGDKELSKDNAAAFDDTNWIIWYQDAEQVVLYYRKPLTKGETTEEALTSLTIDKAINNDYADAQVTLEFEVDAVQKIAAEAAMASEWGVYPTFDEAGNIVSISE